MDSMCVWDMGMYCIWVCVIVCALGVYCVRLRIVHIYVCIVYTIYILPYTTIYPPLPHTHPVSPSDPTPPKPICLSVGI